VLSCRALTSGDIPNNAANTSGTAANVSGTPALPNGTTATTQTTADSTAKIATDAFVVATAAALGALPANGCSTTAGGNLFCATGAFTTVTATTSVTSPLVNGTYSITSGGDACVKINTSLALIGTGNYGTVGIPPGTYTCSATVSYDPTYQSIIGAGPNAVHITARTGSTTFYMTEASYSISTVGELSGFTLTGDGSAGQIGVRTNGVIDPKIDRIVFSGFSGTSAVGLYTYNSLASNGWMERSHMRDLQFLGNTVGWQLACNTGNPSSCSFGYSDIDMQYTVGSGQVGINAVTGTLYHSKLRFTFNGTSGTTAFIQIGTAANWYGNEYSIVGEGTSGTGVTIASGGQMKGYPVLWDLGTASFVDGNAASMAGTSRIVPQAVGAGDFGSISNLGGGGNTGVANILSTYYPSNPYASISTLDGTNVHSLAFTAYNYSGNGWFYLACPFTMTGGLPSCTQAGYLDTSGDWKNQGTSYHVGNVGIGVAPYANPVRLAIGSTSDAINNQVQLNANSGQWVGAQLNINGWNNAWFLLNNSGSAVYGIPNSAVGINTSSGAALSLGANGAEAIHVTPAGVITANGNNLPTAEGTPTAGYATCWKTVGTNPTIGYCSTVVGATGTCTCN